ncbi:MAG: carbohydrate ABC transporter substrate-binding protein [Anaerolineaceae bacterium]|nr:MAG: carbohydrate ABC transporter substrate-binding protein [Anaerolineaceae bacterium]
MVLSLAACGKDNTDAETGGVTKKEDTAKTDDTKKEDTKKEDTKKEDASKPADDTADTKEPVTIKFSWWGGDSRHEATLAAIEKFQETYDWITVEPQYGAWSGWEESMATAFATKTAPDVNQINWNWITSFSSDGSAFKDLNEYSDTIKLENFSKSSLDLCTLAGELQAIPVSMTGRIFYWNKTTFDKAGIATPTNLAELYAAGETFKNVLGDDYYPISLGEYDRMILMVYYLESVYGKAWVVDNELQYTAEEIQKGLEFIQSLEDAHVTPSIQTITGDGAESLDKNPKWMEGKYAGIFEWDSSASKFQKALAEGQEFIVGEYMKDMGDYQGGYAKVSLAFAISETTPYPEECALLINFLLNEDAGVEIMKSERGIPLSKNGLEVCLNKGLLDTTVAEANVKVLSWVSFPLDPKFEAAELKNSDGIYFDAMSGLSYGDYSLADAAQVLVDGIKAALAK